MSALNSFKVVFELSRPNACAVVCFAKKKNNQKIIDNFDYLSNAASSMDCTGLIPSLPRNSEELESYDDVYRYLASLTHDPALAEDLLSETFLCAVQKAGTFRGQSSEKTWLFGIARNVEDRVGEAYDFRQLAERVAQLLEALPERERTIVQLRARGLPYEEIAARCGIRAGSARVIEYRVRQSLKETLRKEGYL